MKRKFYFLLISASVAQAQIAIPDANFKNKLLAANATNNIAFNNLNQSIVIDTNGNNEIEESEALLVDELRVNDSGIASLKGIKSFHNLRILNAMENNIPVLDFSGLSNLTILRLGQSHITSLNVSGLTALKILDLYKNDLAALDVSALTSLETLDTFENTLLSTINLGTISNLNALLIGNNPITSLDLQNLERLGQFECVDTKITALDLSHNPMVNYMVISENSLLNTINLKNMAPETYFITNNENLAFVCADVAQIAALNTYFHGTGQNVTVNSNCLLNTESQTKDKLAKTYPNPVKDILNIEAAGLKAVQLHDMQGRLLKEFPGNGDRTTLNLSERTSGIYLLQIITDNGITTEKIIKQ